MKKTILTAALFVVTFIAAFTTPAFCWWDQGHEIIASIAWDNMDDSTREKLRSLGFDQTRFINAGCYGDDFKNDTNASWHYVNWVYDMKGMQKTMLAGDLLSAIPQMVQNIMSNKKDVVWIKYLIHFLGDLHCPMHNVTFMLNGESDLGGNKFNITLQSGESFKLHAYWDSLPTKIMEKHCQKVGIKYLIKKTTSRNKFEKQLIDTGYSYTDKKYEDYLYDQRQGQFQGIISTGRFLVKKNDIKKEKLSADSISRLVENWSYKEAYPIACSSYHQDMDIEQPFLNSGDTVSEEYENKAKKEAGQRLVLAGMRLASILDSIFSD